MAKNETVAEQERLRKAGDEAFDRWKAKQLAYLVAMADLRKVEDACNCEGDGFCACD